MILKINKNFTFKKFLKKNYEYTKIDNEVVLFGTIFSFFGKKLRITNITSDLKKVLKYGSIEKVQKNLDGRYLVIRKIKNKLEIFTDKNGRYDLYFSKQKNELIISSNIEKIISDSKVNNNLKKLNQFAIASMLVNYGAYALKKNTIYDFINKLGVYEIIIFDLRLNKYRLNYLPRQREKILSDNQVDLKDYYEILKNSIETRMSSSMNWIFMSSGWDSSSILAILSKLVNKNKITAVIGQFKYCNKDGYCNLFEIKRAKAICDYYNIKLIVIKVDWQSQNFFKNFEKYKNLSKSNHLYAMISYNFFQVSEYIKKNSNPSDVVFNGDFSDGIHNFGHSQYANLLSHHDLGFREYIDKMQSYLYSPSFYNKAINGKHVNDEVFQTIITLKKIKKNNILNLKNFSKDQFNFAFFGPLFLNSNRSPFSRIENKIFSKKGQKNFQEFLIKNYFKKLKDINGENIYDGILEMYNNFHWQSGTVRQLNLASEFFGITGTSPFSDTNLLTYISTLSENYGRGLNLRPTKYPLKYILSEYLDYPEKLQTGPHSYLYDVNPNWNVNHEIIFKTKAREMFIQNKKTINDFLDILDKRLFNIDYIKKNINYFYKKDNKRADLLLLINLMGIINIGWYR